MIALSPIGKGASDDQARRFCSSIGGKFQYCSAAGVSCLQGGPVMNRLAEGSLTIGGTAIEPEAPSCHDLLRAETQAPHQRLHLHTGFSAVRDGTIKFTDYQALLVRLYGFYRPFERAAGGDAIRTKWLEGDLAWLGIDAADLPRIRLCAEIPRYDSPARRLGALYVVEGSALGGRQLCRGLDGLLGVAATEGRRFFAGRGAGTGAAWVGFLDRLALVGRDPLSQAALVSAAVETFEVFETWLSGWSAAT